jgi:hypothetical protein
MRHDVTFKELKITDPVPVSWWHAKCSCGAQGSAYTSRSVAQVWKKEHLREVGVEHRIISRSTVINTSSQPKHSASCRCGETSPVFNNANKLKAWEKAHVRQQCYVTVDETSWVSTEYRWSARCTCGESQFGWVRKQDAESWKRNHLANVVTKSDKVKHLVSQCETVGTETLGEPEYWAKCSCGARSKRYLAFGTAQLWEKKHMEKNSNAEKLGVWEIRKGDRVFIQNNADGCGYFSAGDIISVGQRSRYARADEASWVNGSGLLIHKECWPLRILPNDVKTIQAGWVVAEIQRDFTLGPVEKVALSFPASGKMFVLFEPMKKQETLEERVERLENRCCKCCADS